MGPSDLLHVALVQADTVWHDPRANRLALEGAFDGIHGPCDLIVLPETFTSGFSNEAVAWAETMEGKTVAWLREQSALRGAAVTGSVQIREGDRVVNRLLWVTPDGACATYDKRHLFRMAGEHERYAPGSGRLLVDYKGWRICPLVCYDLRFPVFARNRYGRSRPADMDYDVLVFVANWPAERHHAWDVLLRARALENLSYVVGVNRVGTDGAGIRHAGGSLALDFLGEPLAEAGSGRTTVVATLSLSDLRRHRARFPAHLDADSFALSDGDG